MSEQKISAGSDRVQVSMFGGLRVVTSSAVLGARGFPGVKPRQLLEVLICERGHAVSKSRLAELLWGETMPRDYAATLETYVSVLRRTLAPGRPPAQSVVVTEHGGYRIGPEGVEVDLDLFDSCRREALSAQDPAAALAALHRALELVRGPVLEDEPYAAWAEPIRETYQERHVSTLVEAGRLSLTLDDAPAALRLAQRAVELQPLAESAYQVLMTSSYALRRQDEALAAFDRCRRLLADELGVDPMQETVDLHLAILRHEQVAPWAGQPGPRPVQVQALPERDVVDSSASTLLGRERELALLQDTVGRARDGHLTLALVTGCAGIGKTALIEQLVSTCDQLVATNRCSALETGFPYLALSLALRSKLPTGGDCGLPALQDLVSRAAPLDRITHLGVMEGFADRLRTQSPLVLWLDDAQCADPETLTTLAYLQRRCPEAPVLVILTVDRSWSTVPALRTLRPDVRIDLGRLPEDCVHALGHEDLFAMTGGHPLYVEGWLRARRAGLLHEFEPELCERVLMACSDAGPDGYRLLRTAAGLEEHTFSPGLLATLVGAPLAEIVDQLDDLVDMGLFTWVADELAFSAPALRSILAAALSPARRAAVLERNQDRQQGRVPVSFAHHDRRLLRAAGQQ